MSVNIRPSFDGFCSGPVTADKHEDDVDGDSGQEGLSFAEGDPVFRFPSRCIDNAVVGVGVVLRLPRPRRRRRRWRRWW